MQRLSHEDNDACKSLQKSINRDLRKTTRLKEMGKRESNSMKTVNHMSIQEMEGTHGDKIALLSTLKADKTKLKDQLAELNRIPDIDTGDIHTHIKQTNQSISTLESYLKQPQAGCNDEGSHKVCTSHLEHLVKTLNAINNKLSGITKMQSEKQQSIRKINLLIQSVNENIDKVQNLDKSNQEWLISFIKHERAAWCPTLAGGVSKPTYSLQAEAYRNSKIERAARQSQLMMETKKRQQKAKKGPSLPCTPEPTSLVEGVPLELQLLCTTNAPQLNDKMEHDKSLTKAKWAAKTTIRNKG